MIGFDITQLTHINLDLLFVGIAVAGIALLSFVVYFSNPKSITNKTFLAFAIVTIFWNISNYFEYQFTTIIATLWALRIHLFLSTIHAFTFFQLAYVFPKEKVSFPRWYLFCIVPLTVFTTCLTLTPFVFTGITTLAQPGFVTNPDRGFGIILFVLLTLGLSISSIFILFRQALKVKDVKHKQTIVFSVGMTITLLFLLIFNVFLPILYNNLSLIPFAGLFMLPFIALTSYAIAHYRLFNVKVITTSLFVFILSVVMFSQILIANTIILIIFHSGIFILILIFGINLIKSVVHEVSLREQLEKQEKNLEVAYDKLEEVDKQKTEFLSEASHQLRTPLTVIKWQTATLLDGSYGWIPKKALEAIQSIFDASTLMAMSVSDYLSVSRIEQGRMEYNFVTVDVAPILKSVVVGLTKVAREKGLTLTVEHVDENVMVLADIGKLTQIISNLIDNSIKYTPTGGITMSLRKVTKDGVARIEIHDTGIGLNKESIAKLFDKFARADNGKQVNVGGTGLGLFLVKTFVVAHLGKVWVESPGEVKGSTFIIEIPLFFDQNATAVLSTKLTAA